MYFCAAPIVTRVGKRAARRLLTRAIPSACERQTSVPLSPDPTALPVPVRVS